MKTIYALLLATVTAAAQQPSATPQSASPEPANAQGAQSAPHKTDKAAAGSLLGIGDRPAPKGLDGAELAAWTSVARILLNLHETVTRN